MCAVSACHVARGRTGDKVRVESSRVNPSLPHSFSLIHTRPHSFSRTPSRSSLTPSTFLSLSRVLYPSHFLPHTRFFFYLPPPRFLSLSLTRVSFSPVLSPAHSLSHLLTLPHTHTVSLAPLSLHILSLTRFVFLSVSSRCHTHSRSVSLTLFLSHTRSLTRSDSLSLVPTRTLSSFLSHTRFLSHAFLHLPLTPSLSHSHALSLSLTPPL